MTINRRADHEAADALESALKSAVDGNDRVAADFSGLLLYFERRPPGPWCKPPGPRNPRDPSSLFGGASEMVRKVFSVSGIDQLLRMAWRSRLAEHMLEEVVLLAVDESTGGLRAARLPPELLPMPWSARFFLTLRWRAGLTPIRKQSKLWIALRPAVRAWIVF